ncbi:MAG: drug/metabolite transporter (DMT)-like permease [Cellvibrionaceae bacterium]|jgi:drug/metabolite transporter (DMT)-like permease
MNTRIAVIVLLLSSTGFGLTWLPIKALGEAGLNGLHLVFIITGSVSMVLMPWLIRQRAQWLPILPYMLLVALFGGTTLLAFQVAILHGDVIRVMILFYMLPIWSVLGGCLLLGEVLDRRRIITLILCMGGAFLILEVWNVSWTSFGWIDALALLSGFALAATSIAFRFTLDAPFTSKIGFMFMGGFIIVSTILLLYPTGAAIPGASVLGGALAYSLAWILVVSFGSMWGVTCLGAGRGSVLIVVELVVAVLSVLIITQVGLKLYEAIGCVMVIMAAILEGTRDDEVIAFASPQ